MTILVEPVRAMRGNDPDGDSLFWCEELDGIFYPVPDERIAASKYWEWAVPCEEDDGVLYPVTEGGPHVSTADDHFLTLRRATEMVHYLLRERAGAKLFSDIMIFWEKGNAKKRVSPDLCVFPLIDRHNRRWRSVRLWHELSWPVFIMELL